MEKTRRLPYTVEEPRTRRVPYTVDVNRTRTVPYQVSVTRYRTETRYRWVHDGTGGRLESYTVRVPYTVTVTEYRGTPVDRVRTVPVQVQRTITEPYLTTETRYRSITYTLAEARTRRVPYTVTDTRHRTENYTVTETHYREETYTENVRRSRMVERRMPQEQCPPHIADARALYDQRASQQD